jgi:hypothetical protein
MWSRGRSTAAFGDSEVSNVKPRILTLLTALVTITGTSSGAVPSDISKEHSTLLEQWLRSRSDLRLAIDADCQCDRDLASLRSDMSDPSYQPYYASGDFNDDGHSDFAVLTVARADASRRFLVVFNGPFTSSSNPAFIGRADGILVLSRPSTPPRRLLVGRPYAGAAVLTPRGSAYRLIWGEP